MIWIIGGTTEARQLVERLKGKDFLVTVATESGKEFIETKNLRVGRMDLKQMDSFVKEEKIRVIVDMSHPYAKIVSKNARTVAQANKIEYIRYVREMKEYEDVIELSSYEEAYAYLKSIKGTVFFTTGSKNIKDFEKVRGNNRFIYRVLPALESIEECKNNNVKLRDIIAVLGPFSEEYNRVMFKEMGADYVIMKDSGKIGGTLDKIKACHSLGIKAIVISRKKEQGLNNLSDIEKILIEKY